MNSSPRPDPTAPRLLMCTSTTSASRVDAAERWCYLCGQGVWVSDCMLAEVDKGAVRPACPQCGPGVIHSGPHHAEIHPAQVAQLRSLGLLDTARRVASALNARHGNQHDQHR